MKVLILANGAPPSQALLHRLAAAHDLFIATDGAIHQAALLGVTPDIVSGDFDSVRLDEARAAFPQAQFIATPDQDQADLEKALGVARQHGANRVTIVGAAGGRIDHLLGNFSLLLRYHTQWNLSIMDDGSEVRALSGTDETPGEWKIPTQPNDLISLISLDGLAHVTVAEVRWPLADFPLPVGTLGISNRAAGEAVTVQVRGGVVFICHLFPDRSPAPNSGGVRGEKKASFIPTPPELGAGGRSDAS
jgi:thiamine pyrophosphokinase